MRRSGADSRGVPILVLHTPKQVSSLLGIDASSLRRYARQFASALSASAGVSGRKRLYTPDDIEVLSSVRDLLRNHRVVEAKEVLERQEPSRTVSDIVDIVTKEVVSKLGITDDNSPYRGFIYFVRGGNGLVKIGRTSNLERRIRQIEKQCGRVEVLHTIKTNSDRDHEKMFHFMFRDKRVSGEWFELNASDLSIVEDVALMWS